MNKKQEVANIGGLNFGRAPLHNKGGKDYNSLNHKTLVENKFFTWPPKKPNSYSGFAEEVWNKIGNFPGGQMFCIAGEYTSLGPVRNHDEAIEYIVDDLTQIFGREQDGKIF